MNNTSQEVTLTFNNITIEEANTILAGLQELPAKISNPLTLKLQQQAQPQIVAYKTDSDL